MAIGSDWQVLNLGVRFRQNRSTLWQNPGSLSNFFTFGLCSGTDGQLGGPSPRNFVGVRSGSAWTRLPMNFWQTGWEILTASGSEEQVIASGADGSLRVAPSDDDSGSCWYIRFTKGETLTLTLFLPTSGTKPSEEAFDRQAECLEWNYSVGGHSSYREFITTVPFDPSAGELDSVNLFSNLPFFVTNQLRAIEWLNVRAVRLDL